MLSSEPAQANRETWVVLGSANGSSNLGDESMWHSAIKELRNERGPVRIITDGMNSWDPGIDDVEVIPSFQQALRRGYRVPMRPLRKIVGYPWQRGRALRLASAQGFSQLGGALGAKWRSAIAESDGIIFSGAGAITDDYAVHGVASWSVLTEWASSMGKPVLFVGQGVGPLANPKAQRLVAKMLSTASVVSVRESRSADVVSELSPSTPVHVTPDWAVLNCPSPEDRQLATELKNRLVGEGDFQVLSLHRRHTTTRQQIQELSNWARGMVDANAARNIRTLFVSNMTAGRYSDDRTTADMLTSFWPAGSRSDLVVLREVHSAGVVRALLGLSQGVIATRYHPVVFALAEGVAAYGISYDEYYDQKLQGALANFGIYDNVSRLGSTESNPNRILDALLATNVSIDMDDIRQRTLEPFVYSLKRVGR